MHILDEIIRGFWAMDPSYAERYIPLVARIIKGDFIKNQPLNNNQEHDPQMHISILSGEKPYTVGIRDVFFQSNEITEPSVFMLDMDGPITKYDQFCGPVGMKTKADWLKMADNHPNIIAHLIAIDSGGGEGYAARYMSDAIGQLKKPTISFVSGFAASAAYWIASKTNHIAVSNEMDQVGSIGTYISIWDYEEYLKKEGIRIRDIYARKSKDKNLDYRKALEGDISLIQELADKFNEFFLTHIQTERGDKLKDDSWNSGKMYFAKDALSLGLIDEITTKDQLITDIFNEYKP